MFCEAAEKGDWNVPRAVESDISRSAIAIKTNAQWRSMAREAQLWCSTLCARSIIA